MIGLNEEFVPPQEALPSALPDLLRMFEAGDAAEKQRALLELIIAGAEQELTDCLASSDLFTAQLATAGLWECWLNEEGPEAREQIEEAISLMESGNLVDAERMFHSLSRQFPGWAEPINKHAITRRAWNSVNSWLI